MTMRNTRASFRVHVERMLKDSSSERGYAPKAPPYRIRMSEKGCRAHKCSLPSNVLLNAEKGLLIILCLNMDFRYAITGCSWRLEESTNINQKWKIELLCELAQTNMFLVAGLTAVELRLGLTHRWSVRVPRDLRLDSVIYRPIYSSHTSLLYNDLPIQSSLLSHIHAYHFPHQRPPIVAPVHTLISDTSRPFIHDAQSLPHGPCASTTGFLPVPPSITYL